MSINQSGIYNPTVIFHRYIENLSYNLPHPNLKIHERENDITRGDPYVSASGKHADDQIRPKAIGTDPTHTFIIQNFIPIKIKDFSIRKPQLYFYTTWGSNPT